MGKKSNFNRPKRLKKDEINKQEANPFKSTWSFPVLMSDNRFLLPDNEKQNSKSIFYATPEEAMKIKDKTFNPLFIDSSCIKLFKEGTNGFVPSLWKMKSSVHTLFLWILHHLEYGKDKVFINKQEIHNQTGMSVGTLYFALRVLGENDVVSKSKDKDYYFINAQYLFLGSRGNYYPDCTISNHGDLNASKDEFIKKNKRTIEMKISKTNPPSLDTEPF